MKKISLSIVAVMFAATSVFANALVHAKKIKVKQATCTSCPKGEKCTKTTCTKTTCTNPSCCS